MTGPRTAGEPTNERTASLGGWVTAFASAVKNLTIYPKNHPRVVARADEFVQLLALAPSGCHELEVQGSGLYVAGSLIAPDHLAVEWLAQRCREAGVRAIAIDHDSDPTDVIRFAEALVACRPGSGQSLPQNWQYEQAGVRPIELLVGDHRDASGSRNPDAPPPAAGEHAVQGLRSGLGEQLREIAERPNIRNLVDAIADAGDQPSDERAPSEQVDVLGVISELIPADTSIEPDALAATFEEILSRTLGEAMELVRSDSRVRSADLLRSAVQMARSFFARPDSPELARTALPEGRPEDDTVTADLPALLDEMHALPAAHDLRLPTAQDLEQITPTACRELVGICLHGMVHANAAKQRRTHVRWITSLCTRHPDASLDILEAYVGPRCSVPQHTRLRILSDLLSGGLDGPVRRGGYLDDELLRSGFPEVLPLAARAFRNPEELARMRAALENIAPLLDNGGAEAAAESGVLDTSETIQLLARTGGITALKLLVHSRNERGLRDALLDCARELTLPNAERVALKLHHSDQLPRTYLRRLLRACSRQDWPTSLRAVTAEILSAYIQHNLRNTTAVKLAVAIDALEEVPGPQARNCLKDLVRAGRFTLSSELRTMRQQAREVLARMESRGAR